MINVFQPKLGDEELSAVKEVFASNWIGKGSKTKTLEENFRKWIMRGGGGRQLCNFRQLLH